MVFEKIMLTRENGIAQIFLSTPENLNALTGEMVAELIKAFDICEEDPGVRVIVISGKGKAFCSGGDLKSMGGIIKSGGQDVFAAKFRTDMKRVGDLARRIRRISLPVIASVHGPAAGAGCNMALLCDFKIVSDDAVFYEAFVNVGLIPDMGGVYILSRYLGLSRLNETIMLGKPVMAAEALSLGLVNSVVSRDNLEGETMALALKLAAMPSLSLAKMKRLVNMSLFAGLDAVLEAEEEYQPLCARSDDFLEGVAAFLEKRKPAFR